jgi:hypothetical protein
MVVEVPADDLLQPVPGFRNRLMPASAQFRPDTPEFCRHPLAHRLTMHRELTAFVDRAADMGEPCCRALAEPRASASSSIRRSRAGIPNTPASPVFL